MFRLKKGLFVLFVYDGAPHRGVFAPLFEGVYIVLADETCLEGGGDEGRIVGESDEVDVGVLESLGGHGELVAEDGYHADYFTSGIADGLDSLEAAAAGRDEVFDYHYLAAGTEIAFDEVFKTVVFGSGADIYVGQTESVAHERALGDGTCGHAGYGFHFGEIFEDDAAELYLDKAAHVGIGESFAVVGIYRLVPA